MRLRSGPVRQVKSHSTMTIRIRHSLQRLLERNQLVQLRGARGRYSRRAERCAHDGRTVSEVFRHNSLDAADATQLAQLPVCVTDHRLDLRRLLDFTGLVQSVYFHMSFRGHIGERADKARAARDEALEEDVRDARKGSELGDGDARCQTVKLAHGTAGQFRADNVRVLGELTNDV